MARAIAHYPEPQPPELSRVTLELAVDEARAVYGILGACAHGGPTSAVYEALSLVLPFDPAEQRDYQRRARIRSKE